MAGGFEKNTRRLIVKMDSIAPSVYTGQTKTVPLPRSGLLSAIRLLVSVTLSGTPDSPLATGIPALVNNIRVTLNNGTSVFNVSGAGYHHILRNFINDYHDPVPGASRAAVSATTFNVDFFIPIAMSNRDLVGLINLQNEMTQATLSIDWTAQATLTGGATSTITALTAQPYAEIFTIPTDPADMPPLGVLHQIVEEQQAIAGAGAFTYNVPRGNTILQLLCGAGISAANSTENWTDALLRMQQSYFLYPAATPTYFDNEYAETHAPIIASPAALRRKGVIPFDFMGTSGLGMYGSYRDAIDSAQLTDLAVVLTASGAGTFYAIRRQLVAMQGM